MKRTITYKEKRRMEDLGRANSWQPHSTNPDMRLWNEDWSAEKVADETGKGLTASHVRGFYRTIGLDIRAGTPPDVNAGRLVKLDERIKKLEDIIYTQAQLIDAMAQRIATLEAPIPVPGGKKPS